MRRLDTGAMDSPAVIRRQLAAEILRSENLLFPATGWSMFPTVRPGDTLMVEFAMPCDLRKGDIVVIARNGKFVDHRLISMAAAGKSLTLYTQGDASPVPDQSASDTELVGRVRSVIRRGKYIPIAKQSATRIVIAKAVRRSWPALRALIRLRNDLRRCFRAGGQSRSESVAACQV